MRIMDETKKCRACRKEIAVDAKKCPYCRTIQRWWCDPFVIATVGLVSYLLIMFLFGRLFSELFSDIYDEGEPFTNYSNALQISESELTFGEKDCGPTVVILGKVTNNSKVNWDSIHFEVNCYNSENELMDTAQDYDYSLTAPAESAVSFKVSFIREFPEADYSRHEVRIIQAEDADRY